MWSYSDRPNHENEISIRFEGYAALVVAERLWHPRQEIRQLNKDCSMIEFQARLSGLEEITRWVQSWGSKAKVLGPPELKKRIMAGIEKMRATNA